MNVTCTEEYKEPHYYYRFSIVSSPHTLVIETNRRLTREEVEVKGQEAGRELTKRVFAVK